MNFITKRIRQIFLGNRMQKRVIASVLALCMIVTTMFSHGSIIAWAADENVNLTGFTATIGGVSLDQVTSLKDGDEIRIEFNWALANTDDDTNVFIANIDPLKNIVLVNYPEAPLEVDGYGVVGTYSIIDNKFTITLDKTTDFYADDQRNGWAHISGKIQVDDGNAQDGQLVDYQIGTASGQFTYEKDVVESSMSVSKWGSGSVEKAADGTYQQKFRVRVSAQNGEVKNINLSDEMGSGLSGLKAVSVVNTNVSSLASNTTVYSDLNAPLNGVTLQGGEYVELEYTVTVDKTVYASNADWSAFKNKIKATYTNNIPSDKTAESGDAYVYVNRPSVTKSGTIPEGTKNAVWTITIQLNDLKDDDTFANLVSSIVDTPGAGLANAGTPVTLDKSLFTETTPGVYTYTYTTPIDDNYYNSISNLELKNNVKATIAGNEYVGSASVKTPGVTGIISKSVDAVDPFDENSNMIKWNVTVDASKLPADVTQLYICDRASDVIGDITGSHTVNGAPNVQIWVDGTKVVEGGNVIAANGIVDSCTGYYTEDILISEAYLQQKIAAGEEIVVTFQSYVRDTDRANKIYQNTAYAKYIDPVTGQQASTPTVSAQWVDTSVEKNAIEKAGAQVGGKNTIAYTLKVNTSYISGFAAGQNIELVDVLPDNMKYDDGSFKLADYFNSTWNYYEVQDYLYNQAGASRSTGNVVTYEEGGKNKIKFVIPVTDSMVNLAQNAKSKSEELYLQITYTTTVEDAKEFLQNGEGVAFTNQVTGTFGQKNIGNDSTATVLTPSNVISKVGTYNQATCPNVVYSVEVNPQALDLSDGMLTAVDQLGDALSFNLSSIKVYENVNGTWQEMTSGYTYSRNLADNSITFTLPDSKHLRIEYSARVLLAYSSDPAKNGQLTAENAFNKFNLSGMKESTGGSNVQTVSAVIEPAVGAEAVTGSIKLWKYWGGSGSAHPLDGCTFTVYETTYDEGTKTYSVNTNAVFKDDIAVDSNGEVTIYRLTKDVVYALVEKTAKDGYKLNEEPYYFVIPSSSDTTAFEGTNANVYTGSSPTLPFENEVDDAKGILQLSKNVSGVQFNKIKSGLEFVVTGPGNYSKTISGEELTEYGNTITLTNLEPGEYVVKETGKTAAGYTCLSTTYSVNGAATVAGDTTGNISVESNKTATVVFNNDYEQIKGSLKLTKKLTGTPTPPSTTEAKKNLSFTITGPDGTSWVVKGEDLDDSDPSAIVIHDLVPGVYTIVETVGLVTNYSRVETTNVVTVPGETPVTTQSITASNVEIVSGETTQVDYTNDYEQGTGSIRLSKSAKGLAFDDIKDNLKFIITKPDGSTTEVLGTDLTGPGNSYEIGGLVLGNYKVQEVATAPDGYTLYSTTYSVSALDGGATKTGNTTGEFAIDSGDIIEVSFENAYQQNKGALKISKEVIGAGLTVDDVDDSIAFVVTGPGYYEEIPGTKLTETGNSFTIEGLWPGTYTIAEKTAEVEGYSLVSVKNVVVGGDSEGQAEATFVIESDKTAEIKYTNTYEYGKGSILLKKTSSGADFDKIKDTLTYTITGPTGYSKTIQGTELTGTEHSIVIGGLEPGDYTITESRHDDSSEYAYKTTVYRVNGGTLQNGDSVSGVALESGKILEVEFTNTYDLILGHMKLVKNVAMSGAGSITLDDVRSSLTFRITGPKNYNKTFTGAQLTTGGNALVLTDLVPGTYIITEETTELSDYNLLRTEHVSGENSVSGKIATVIVKPSKTANEVTVIEFNNIYEKKKGSLKLEKTVAGGASFDDVKEALSFTITGPDDYLKTVKGTELVEDGNSLTIHNLPIGDYTIVESVDDVDGYIYESTTNTSGQGTTAAVTIGDDAVSTVTFTNTYSVAPSEKGELVITKMIKGDVTREEVEGALQFKVTKILSGASTTYTLDKFQYDAATRTYTLTLEKVPGGYTVEEIASTIDGYKVTVKSSIGTDALADGASQTAQVVDQQSTQVNFEDTYELRVGSLKLTKNFAGGVPTDEALDEISFLITGPRGYSETYNGSVLNEPGNSLTIDNLPIGVYTIVETVGDTEDYVYVSTVNSADNGEKTAQVTVPEGQTADVEFTNTYRQKPGKLIITKTIKGDVTKEEAEGAITFTVTSDDDPSDSTVYTLEDFECDAQTGVYTLTLEKKAGGYTVEETTHDITGKAVTVKYSVDGAAQTEDDSADVMLTPGDETTVDFEDTYRQMRGDLKLTKRVNGADFEQVKGELSFEITGPNGYTKTVKGTELDATTQSIRIEDLDIGNYTVVETVKGVVGYKYVATVNSTANGTTTAEVEIRDNNETELIFTNEYQEVETGTLRIVKKLLGDITDEEAKGALQFEVTDNTSGESTTYTLADFTYNAAEDVYEKTIPANVGGYTIKETVYDVDGYVTDSVTYTVNGGQETAGAEVEVDVVKDETTEVVFKDDYTKDEGKLVITKTIKGDVTKEEAEGALQFKVTDTATGVSKTYTLKDFTYNEATGVYTLELTLPSGTYTVEETICDIKGYITSSVKYKVGTGSYADGKKAEADLKAGGTVNVDFEDAYEKNEGKLVLTKSVEGDLIWDDVKDSLSFTVKNVKSGESKTYKAADFKDVDGDGRYELVIDGLEPGEYQVTEKIDDVKGYLLETTYRIDGGSKQVGTKATATLTKDGVQVDFVNTYTSTRGKLLITKTLLGNIKRKDAESVLEFKVTNEQTGKSKTYTLEDFDYNKKTERYELELILESGKYKVTETQYDVKGYELRSVTYTIGDGEKMEGTSAKVKVKAGKTIKVAFADRYIKKKTSDRTDTTPNTPSAPGTPTTTDRNTPKTGDESPLMLWIMMLLLGACGIGGSVYGFRKEKKK